MIRGIFLWVGIMVFCALSRDVIGSMPILVNLKSFFLVLLGTLIGGSLSIPVNAFAGFQQNLVRSMKEKGLDHEALIQRIAVLARLHRTLHVRELGPRYKTLENPFLRRGMLNLLDNGARERIEETMEKEISLYLERLSAQQAAIHNYARLAPVFGFVGTIIGLINVLNHMGDATLIGHGMAISLLTTFYGLLIANFALTPLAGKFAAFIQRETVALNIVLEGVLAIGDECTSTEVLHRLSSYVESEGSTQTPSSSVPHGIWQKMSSAMNSDGLAR